MTAKSFCGDLNSVFVTGDVCGAFSGVLCLHITCSAKYFLALNQLVGSPDDLYSCRSGPRGALVRHLAAGDVEQRRLQCGADGDGLI